MTEDNGLAKEIMRKIVEDVEYVGQEYLPIASTIGELRNQIKDLPDEMPFGFLNQPIQQIAIREYSDGSKYAVYNGTGESNIRLLK